MQQVLWNVIGNAVKFTPFGGKVIIRTCNGTSTPGDCRGTCNGRQTCRKGEGNLRNGQFIAIHVTDNGIGITPDSLEKLFEAFERGEPCPNSGRGIGLAISRALVELHGGQLVAHSSGRGRGSTFTIILPLRSVCLLEAEKHAPRRPARLKHDTHRVLLVEDHADTARVLSHLLRDMGYEVATAGTVDSAKCILESQPFDLLISDIGLPDGSGLDVVRQARRVTPCPPSHSPATAWTKTFAAARKPASPSTWSNPSTSPNSKAPSTASWPSTETCSPPAPLSITIRSRNSPRGGTADATDLKSVDRKVVRVRLPPRAFSIH